MDRNSNAYTFIFAIVTVVIIAAGLAFTATTLKPLQAENVRKEKMQNIISTIGVDANRDESAELFKKYIKKQLVLKADGTIDDAVDAFTLDLKKELHKPYAQQRFPIYLAEKDGKKYYIIPLFGSGLWDDIWGYIALDSDKNTIVGASFDHKGETPGLGAEINQSWFEDEFKGKKIFDDNGDFVSVKAVKGGAKPDDVHGVDAISGGTLTCNGLTHMLEERLKNYVPYLKKN
ncbi:MAG: NADH:ubiquinone reductase (Na(+)-transporting) subunit C [Flavobacteriia bacterium]|nr:MAG: NADH:ubiquinone reductase (Na(+)-transporting) subunit C [Flavobacteriia bacterium]